MIRLCISGAPWCSGLNPCEPCHLAVMTRVLPYAMTAAGFNEDPAIAQAFFGAYVKAWRELQTTIPTAAPPTPPAAPAAATPTPVSAVQQELLREPVPVQREVSGLGGGEESAPITRHVAVEAEAACGPCGPIATTDIAPSEPAAAEPEPTIPPPYVEGLQSVDSDAAEPSEVPKPPDSDTIISKRDKNTKRRKNSLKRGLPRSLRRASK